MKKRLLRYLPASLRVRLQKWRQRGRASQFQGKGHKEVFLSIYQENHWGNETSVSGPGSAWRMRPEMQERFRDLFDRYQIQSMLDLPCGDLYWIQALNLGAVKYLGADIVPDLIAQNREKFPEREFQVIDLISEVPPGVDLILNRDCLVHFCYADIFKALEQIRQSGARYLLSTHFVDQPDNRDIITGEWRPLNLQKAPFHFPEPLEILPEYFPPGFEKAGKGKSLALWMIKDLPPLA